MRSLPDCTGSRTLCALATAAVLVASAGCASLSSTEEGAVIGGGAGAVVGGIIGKNTGSTARGAIIGAVVGGAAGAAIGRRMDQQAEELASQLPNATVERVGEGIGVTFDSGILFDVDESELRSVARDNLTELAESLEAYEDTRVLVVGHTDSTGSDSYNQALSERRATSARAHLLNQGIQPDRVEALGRGESEPVETNETAEGRQLNRRVEIAIFASEELQQEMLERHGG